MDYKLIKNKITKAGFTIKQVAELIELTEAGLHRAFSNDTLTVNKLEKIAEVLGISPRDFFPEIGYTTALATEPNTDYKSEAEKTREDIEIMKAEIERLKKKVEGKK